MVAETAVDRLYRTYPNGSDHPMIRVWMPTSVPFARLEVISGGCGEADVLPTGYKDRPAAYLRIAGIEIGGYLDELDLQIEAAREELARVRDYYEVLRETEALRDAAEVLP